MIIANHERAYAVAPKDDQRIYAIAGNLVIPKNNVAETEKVAFSYATSLKSKLFGESSCDPEQLGLDALIVGYRKGIVIVDGNVRQSNASSDISITLGDPLKQVNLDGQLGILTKEFAKVLYAPNARLTVIPKHYSDGFKRETNDKFYATLANQLQSGDFKKANRTIDAFLNEEYSLIDRAIFTVVKTVKQTIQSSPTIFSPKRRSNEESYRNDVTKSNDRLIVRVKPKDRCMGALCAYVQGYADSDCVALDSSPALIIKNDPKELPRLMRYLSNEKTSMGEILNVRQAKRIVVPLPKPTIARKPLGVLEHVALINAYAAHKTTRGNGITVAIMDTGVDYTHPFLASSFSENKGRDFVRNTDNPMDMHGHGTHVAGIVKSIAPDVTLKAVRVLDEDGCGSEADILLAFEYCYKNSIPIINCSFGAPGCSEEEREVVEAAREYGTLIVAAAGNESTQWSPDKESYPAVLGGVQSIGSVNRSREHSSFSNMGFVDFAAMGEQVLSTLPGNEYGVLSGTSMASPCVAGAFALQRSVKQSSLDDLIMMAAARCSKASGYSDQKQYERRFGNGLPDCARWVE